MTKDQATYARSTRTYRRANRDPKRVKALAAYAHEAVVSTRQRGHVYLTEGRRPGRPGALPLDPAARLPARARQARQAERHRGRTPGVPLFDSGGEFVEALAGTRTGGLYGGDGDVPTGDGGPLVRKQSARNKVTRRASGGACGGGRRTYIVSSFATLTRARSSKTARSGSRPPADAL